MKAIRIVLCKQDTCIAETKTNKKKKAEIGIFSERKYTMSILS